MERMWQLHPHLLSVEKVIITPILQAVRKIRDNACDNAGAMSGIHESSKKKKTLWLLSLENYILALSSLVSRGCFY